MRILRLHISAFGHLHDRTIEFGDGLTVLLGTNEAGKSTTLHCLAQVLYGKPSQRSLFPDFTPWSGGEFAAEVDIQREGLRYRLRRQFAESGTRAVALVQLRDDGSERLVTREASEVRHWVAEAFGTGDDRIFYRVFCLTQADLDPLDNFTGLREQLERVAGGAEVAVTAAIQRVDARLTLLRRGVGQPALMQNWGPLKRAAESRQDWESRLHEAKRQQRRCADVRDQLDAVHAKALQANRRVEEITSLLEQERRRQELTARLTGLRADWHTCEEHHERLARLLTERDRLQACVTALPPIYADPDAVRRLQTAGDAKRGSLLLGWAMLIAGVLLGVGCLATTVPQWIGITAVAVLLCGLALLLRNAAGKVALARLCAAFGVAQPSDALRRLGDLESDRQALAAIHLALDAVNDSDDMGNRRRELARDVAVLEEKIAQIPGQALFAEDGHRLAIEMQTLRAALPGWQGEERELLRELAVLEQAERDLIDLEDGVEYWRKEEERAREEEQTLLLARDLLAQAGEQAHGAITEPLAARISPLFAAMTGGRYPYVRVTGDANRLDMYPVDATDSPVPPDQLSRGTRDQFLLAVRLALGQVIAGPMGSPIFLLDDPLLHFDGERRKEALAMLQDVAIRHQIILATHEATLAADLPDATIIHLNGNVASTVAST